MLNEKKIYAIGKVINSAQKEDKPGVIKEMFSQIEIYDNYAEGMTGIEKHDYILVVFGLDLNSEVHMKEKTLNGNELGIYACRSQFRPNHIGVTQCEIIKVEDNILTLKGLDACNNSLVYDLKCPDTSEYDRNYIHEQLLLKNPRHDIDYYIRNKQIMPLLIKAGQFADNLNSDLAIGIIAGVDFIERIKSKKIDSSKFIIKGSFDNDIILGLAFILNINFRSDRLINENINSYILTDGNNIFTYKLKKYNNNNFELVNFGFNLYWNLEII